MRLTRNTFTAVLLLILCQISLPAFSQLGIPITISKPKEYEERVLRSEKSEDSKFTLPKRFIQNTVTHYNYYFNANTKLNEVLERAKLGFKDDYSELLPFYNYSLDVTAGDSIQLDSITYKSSSGIALHDLRNDWVDNLYLLWGASFYLQKKFDSAYLMFQFINYAFAPKEKDGYYLTIGSARDGNSAYSIATKEKSSIAKKIFSEPPSRNDAFIWQIRNFLAQDQFAEASSLIVALKNDPVFPKRLHNDLSEVQSFWFYKQKMWDSAAVHLTNALNNATNLQEKARWEYLAAQLYELSGNYKESEKYFGKVSTHTTDPILDIYARLSALRVNRDGGEQTIEKNVAKLIRMAKQDKYEDYRDIIYYMAAQMQLQGNNIDEAIALLLKSTKYSNNGEEQRNKAFLQLADLSLAKKNYRQAYNFYDSLKLDDPSLKNVDEIKAKKTSLGLIAGNLEIIERQDSLQRIAAMPEDNRKDFVKKLVKQLRKQQGLKDEPSSTGSPFTTPTIPSLFPTNTKGEWYFYNTASRSRGQADFKSRWGTRANMDNWRRSAATGNIIPNNVSGQNPNNRTPGGQQETELSFDALYDNLPLTPEAIKVSNDSIQEAMLALGKAYIQNIEDCNAGTATLEELRIRFPEYAKMDEVLFNLFYCYNKNGDAARAATLKKSLSQNFVNSDFNKILTTGINPNSGLPNPEATKTYEDIYDLFIEGNFAEAIAQKKKADSIYNKNFWTPQLLYIEAVYYAKQRDDSAAKKVLNNLITQFGDSPLKEKATTLLDVLGRRAQIEEELKNMVVTRLPEDKVSLPKDPVTIITQPKPDTANVQPVTPIPPIVVNNVPPQDTSMVKPPVTVSSSYVNSPNEAHYVVLLLNKVDPVFSNEAKNAFLRFNRTNYSAKNYSADLFELNAEYKLLLIAPFTNAQDAINYIEKTKPRTASEIIPWLKGGKYFFSILTNGNFDVLKFNMDVDVYKAFLNQHFPGKFD
ncbi:MAG: hypothetical protein KA968_03195 [Chitinophagaceae bacterium]|nr:hypothetical protein [Chitinophagaceae bacterium]MBP7314197.1 hypothetical protein [Chitinophagaceae bacterium]HQX96220.1 hypothetical protein [Chitinophagaceae bacterium]HQZ50310.1 hypothetical protein [Chitinophagaceae bacterium]HRA10714.1 hypothetical protein [Chitinophagaceae bacterium]